MNARSMLAAACAGALLMCNAAAAQERSDSPPPASSAVPSLPQALEALEPGSVVLLEVPGNVQGSVEIVAVPVEVLAMMLRQGNITIEAAPAPPAPRGPEPSSRPGVGI
jgi:hypothetical protein